MIHSSKDNILIPLTATVSKGCLVTQRRGLSHLEKGGFSTKWSKLCVRVSAHGQCNSVLCPHLKFMQAEPTSQVGGCSLAHV